MKLSGTSVAISLLLLVAWLAPAQDSGSGPTLSRNRYRSGEETLRAFAPISEATRHSIVRLNVNGEPVALAAVVDTNGLALSKASEIKPGKLTCWLAIEKEVAAEVLRVDEEEDVALVRVHAEGLRPVTWALDKVSVGQWAITPGIAETPHAVGIISALPHRVRPRRALIGVQFDSNSGLPKIQKVYAGLGAEKAGLKVGDVIVGVNSVAVTNRDQVVETLREFRDGQTIRLKIGREAEQFEADVRMTVPKAGELASEFYSQPRIQMTGELSQRAEGFEQAIEHDTVLPPWLCGGPLVNLEGKAIGLNIARAGRVTTYALPAQLVLRTLERLRDMPARPAAGSE